MPGPAYSEWTTQDLTDALEIARATVIANMFDVGPGWAECDCCNSPRVATIAEVIHAPDCGACAFLDLLPPEEAGEKKGKV